MAMPIARLTLDRTREEASRSGTVQLGFLMATMTVVVTAIFAVVAIATPARSGPFCQSGCVPAPYVDVGQFILGDYLWLIPGILLAPLFVGLVVCIHSYATDTRKAFSRIAISFAVIYAAVIIVNYFVQFTVVIPSLQAGETQNLSLLTQYNPHGFFIALEVLAYLSMAATFLAATPVFAGGKLERTIRMVFTLGFVAAAAAFVGFWLEAHDLIAVEVTILMIDWVVLIVGGTLLGILFRRGNRA